MKKFAVDFHTAIHIIAGHLGRFGIDFLLSWESSDIVHFKITLVSSQLPMRFYRAFPITWFFIISTIKLQEMECKLEREPGKIPALPINEFFHDVVKVIIDDASRLYRFA